MAYLGLVCFPHMPNSSLAKAYVNSIIICCLCIFHAHGIRIQQVGLILVIDSKACAPSNVSDRMENCRQPFTIKQCISSIKGKQSLTVLHPLCKPFIILYYHNHLYCHRSINNQFTSQN